MFDYITVNQVATLKPKAFRRLSDDAMSVGINADIGKLVSGCAKDEAEGWGIVSHCLQFFENRQVVSLLLRRPHRA